MFVEMYLTLVNVILFTFNGEVFIYHQLAQGLAVILGSCFSLYVLQSAIKRTGKASIVVIMLLVFLIIALCMTVIFDGPHMVKDFADRGWSIFSPSIGIL